MNKITQEILKDIGSLPPEMQEEALDFVRFLKAKQSSRGLKANDSELNGTKLAQLMKEGSNKGLFAHIKDPASWQREIREDRPLPGREN